MKTVRVATTKTGQSYIVNHIDFGSASSPSADPIVRCWGEVVAVRFNRTTSAVGDAKHAASKAFVQSAVTLSEGPRNIALMTRLIEQAKRAARAGVLPGYR